MVMVEPHTMIHLEKWMSLLNVPGAKHKDTYMLTCTQYIKEIPTAIQYRRRCSSKMEPMPKMCDAKEVFSGSRNTIGQM